MESISAIIGQCPYLASAERISPPVPKPAFRWNAAPLNPERHQIRFTLSQVRSDLAALDDTLANITSIQTRLLQKRDALQVFSDELKTLIPSIRTILPEILIEIFYYLKGDYRDEAPARARAGSLLPTHVCQQWRQIALSTPSLWNNIYINGSSVSRSLPSSEVKCIKTWLARSKNSPLSINLRWNDGWGGKLDFEEGGVWCAVFGVLLQCRRRWRHAILLWTPTIDFSALRNNLPLLETLEIHCPYDDVNIDGNAFEIAPWLSSVTLSPGLTIDTLPWGQLKFFIHEFVMSILQSLTSLQQMSNIVSYDTGIVYDESEDIGFLNTPLHLSKLESLTVCESDQFGMDRYLACLTLPSLTSIKLFQDSFNQTPDDCISAVISLIQRSSCSLKAFEINASGWSSPLCALLQVTPQLETLGIDGRALEYDFDKTVQLLVAPFGASSTSCLAPKLQHLNLRCRPPFEPQAFVNMVDSRWRVTSGGCVTPFKSVRLSGIPSATTFNSSELERLKAFAAEGLDIEFFTFAGDPILFEKIDSVST
ncbi:hypothetical protein HWV62_36644 [Athelia sp. TMB]|nr:hypothetical protein HWV62_36644 [Athelia sp. TMB]